MQQPIPKPGSLSRGDSSPSVRCARVLLDVLPLIMDFVRSEMRRSPAPPVSVPQFRALVFLKRNGGACLSDVARHLGVSMATASAMIERLVRQGLVEREPLPQERRRVALNLTETALVLVSQAQASTLESLGELLSQLSVEELERMSQDFALLRTTLAHQRSAGSSGS
jgi:DNA-binding MarR family transcriptional regulator